MCTGSPKLLKMSAQVDPDYKAPRLQLSLADFELLRRIGDGSYSHVVLARQRSTGQEFALKIIDKQYILRHKVVDYIRRERQVLDSLQYDGIARLYFTFQDAYSLYLGLEYCPNGELYDQIRLRGQLDVDTSRFYAAEVVLMLEKLRSHGIVHRDLKPENLLLDGEGHLKLIDFGSAKQLPPPTAPAAGPSAAAGDSSDDGEDGSRGAGDAGAVADGPLTAVDGGSTAVSQQPQQQGQVRSEQLAPVQAGSSGSRSEEEEEQQEENEEEEEEEEAGGRRGRGMASSKRMVSLVGTADYVSPEILNNRNVTYAADLWALGCLLFQMFAGRPPFKSPSEYLTFQKIVTANYQLPEGLSPEAEDLITRLLQLEPEQRLGAGDLGELKCHAFFQGIDWEQLRSQQAPEFVQEELDPALSSASSSFDWELQSLASALPTGAA